jgi:excisionase family DNA binding protein
VADNVFYIFLWVEDRGLAGFFFVRFGERKAFGDAAAHRLDGMKERHGPLAIFDDDLRPRAHPCHQQTQVSEHLIQKIRDAITAIAAQTSVCPVISEVNSLRSFPEDPWLQQTEAATYLGVSKSTLYQYACKRKIEYRKLGGRLEYRRSTLDRFKDLQVRRTHEWFPKKSIITTALGSGK